MAAGDQRTLRDTSPAGDVLALSSAGAAVAQGRAVVVSCTVGGTITFTFPTTHTMQLTLPAAGIYEFNYAVTGYTIGTATASVFNLY